MVGMFFVHNLLRDQNYEFCPLVDIPQPRRRLKQNELEITTTLNCDTTSGVFGTRN